MSISSTGAPKHSSSNKVVGATAAGDGGGSGGLGSGVDGEW